MSLILHYKDQPNPEADYCQHWLYTIWAFENVFVSLSLFNNWNKAKQMFFKYPYCMKPFLVVSSYITNMPQVLIRVILNMSFLRRHWYDLGAFFSIAVLIGVAITYPRLTDYQLLMWLSLVALFLHQLEEYRIIGTFPGMVKTAMYRSTMPDRYPLNSNSAFYVNVAVGWTLYLLAAVFSEKVVWLGMATILVSAGNTIAHTIVFNRKGKTIYNAGMATSLLIFVPCTYFFFSIICIQHLATPTDYIFGIALGIAINVVGISKLIDWMADKNTIYIFEERNLLQQHKKKNSR